MKIIFFLSILLAGLPSVAQLTSKLDEASGKYGYVNSTGAWVISPQYDDAQYFSSGRATVKKNDLYGVVNEKNEIIIPIQYKSVGEYSENSYPVQDVSSEKFGFCDLNGNLFIQPKFSDAMYFSEGLAAVEMNGKWGFIDKTGKLVIAANYDSSSNSYDAYDDWSWLLEEAYGYAFYNGYCVMKKNGLYGAIDKTDKTIIPFSYTSVDYDYVSRQAIVSQCDVNGENCKYGVVGPGGNIVVPMNYSFITSEAEYYKLHQGSYYDDINLAETGGMIGYADQNGNVIVPCIYDNDNEGMYTNLFDGFYDSRYNRSFFQEGLFNLRKNGIWGYVSTSGSEVIPFQFESASSFYLDSARVSLNGNEFYINKEGKCIRNCPENISLTIPGSTADQMQNYLDVMNATMDFFMNESPSLAGDELNRRTEEVYKNVRQKLELVISYGTQAQKNFAKYLKMIYHIEIGNAYGKKAVQDSYPWYQPVRHIVDNFTASDFPIVFDYNGSRQYAYEDFESNKRSYYSSFAECEYLMKDPQAADDLKKAIDMQTNSWSKAVLTSYYIDFKQKRKEYDAELLQYSNLLLENYLQQDEANRNKLDAQNLWKGNQPAAIEAAYTSNSSSTIPLGFYTTAYPLYHRLGDSVNEQFMMKRAFENGFDDAQFYWDYAEVLKNQSDLKELSKLADHIYIKTLPGECERLQRLAELYMTLGNDGKATEVKKMADKCLSAHEEEVKENEKMAKRNEKKSSRSSSSYGTNGGLAFGVDLLPLLTTVNGHRDYGFFVDFIGRHSAHEFYYEIINKNRDQMFDMSTKSIDLKDLDLRWSGYNASYAYKKFTDSGRSPAYLGVLVRYRSKTFESQNSDVLDNNSTVLEASRTFNASETQYELFLNYGVMTTRPGFYADAYFGFGPKYSVFKSDAKDSEQQFVYTNPLLENRAETRWGIGLRIGVTVGFKIF